jgi:GNAT superfamily N-acetyltransferase
MLRYEGPTVLPLADELHDVYADAFSGPPWNKRQAGIDQFRHRLDTDVDRAGFRAVITTSPDGIDGFATGWITGQPFRSDRAYGMVAEQLGPERVERMLVGAFEVDELAVRPRARRGGLGRQLLAELISHAPGGRAWLLTSQQITDTVAFYHRVGWYEVPPLSGRDNGIVVFLGPAHPTRDVPVQPGRSHHGG